MGIKGQTRRHLCSPSAKSLAQIAGYLIAWEGEPEIFPSGSKHFYKHHLFSAAPCTSHATEGFSGAEWMAREKAHIIPKQTSFTFQPLGVHQVRKRATNQVWVESITSSGWAPIGWNYYWQSFHGSKLTLVKNSYPTGRPSFPSLLLLIFKLRKG